MIDRLTSEAYALILIIATGGLLFGAQIMEHQFDMDPCPLCLMQRIWFFVAGAFAFASLLHNPRWGIYPLCSLAAALGDSRARLLGTRRIHVRRANPAAFLGEAERDGPADSPGRPGHDA